VVHRYLDAERAGTLAPKTAWGSWRKLDPAQLSAHLRKHPDATLHETGAVFRVNHHAVWKSLRKLGITLKKVVRYRERNEVQRWLFRRELARHAGRNVVYLDESGIEHRLYREYGRAPRGKKIYQEVCGAKRRRTGIIAAAKDGKLIAPLIFGGTCDTALMDAYFRQVLLPALPQGSVIVLDNARFHQAESTRRWSRPLAVNCSSCQLIRPTSIPSNTSGPNSKPNCAPCSPPPTILFLTSLMCRYVFVKDYSITKGRSRFLLHEPDFKNR
jgi:hypothetical protein